MTFAHAQQQQRTVAAGRDAGKRARHTGNGDWLSATTVSYTGGRSGDLSLRELLNNKPGLAETRRGSGRG